MATLALTYYHLEKYPETEKFQIKVVDAQCTIIGAEHTNTIMAMQRLAETFKCLGKYAEQEQLETQLMKVEKRVSGEQHQASVRTMVSLPAGNVMNDRIHIHEKSTCFIHYSIYTNSHGSINQIIIFSIYQRKFRWLDLNSQIGFIKRRTQLQHDQFINPNLSLKYLD
jgi:hypothetical protein